MNIEEPHTEWEDAMLAAALLAVNPGQLHGVWLEAKPGPVRDLWLDYLRDLLRPEAPSGKLPLNATEETLFGGVDLAAALATGKLVRRPGMLARLNGGTLIVPLAERLTKGLGAQLGSLLDRGEAVMEQDGLSSRFDAMIQIVALDESEPDDNPEDAALSERLAFRLTLARTSIRDAVSASFTADEVASARERLDFVEMPHSVLAAICMASIELGIVSMRGPLLALAAAKAHAALRGSAIVDAEDAAVAGRLVLAPRATVTPALEETRGENQDNSGDPKAGGAKGEGDADADAKDMADIVLAAAKAALPRKLLGTLPKGAQKGSPKGQGGRSGLERTGGLRGRSYGARRARGKHGERISAVDTIRAAAPWQRLRARHAGSDGIKFHVSKEDLRVRRYKSFAQTTTIFAVDASGSAALQRLSEAKGAVELLLADCYVRRDRVALIAFRGHDAAILLPPTRSLVRAKRALNALAGGGGTPLAAGIRAAAALAGKTRRDGGSPIVVLLTDGRANVSATREANRDSAHADALKIARCLRSLQVPSLLVDTSPRPQPKAGQLAREMGALYLPLPYADARAISAAARSMSAA